MSKRQWLTILGIWFMFFLFLGIPSSWHKVISIISGLIIIAIAYNLPQEEKKIPSGTSSFIENETKDTLLNK